MKKILLLLVLFLGFGLVACGNSGESNSVVDSNEVDSNEVDSNDDDSNEVDSNEVDSNDDGSNEVDSNDNGSNEVDSNDDSNDVDSNRGDSHELVGEWIYLDMVPWFRFYEDGSAISLQDGEEFTWNEDGSLNSLLYESWSISDDTLTINWSVGDVSFNYIRAD